MRNLHVQMQETPEIVPFVTVPDVKVDRRVLEPLRSQCVRTRIQSAGNWPELNPFLRCPLDPSDARLVEAILPRGFHIHPGRFTKTSW